MKLKAFAKINLTLDILGRRDDGYHSLDTLMQSVSLYDEIEIEKSEHINIICDDSCLKSQKNIAEVAAEKFFEFCKIKGGCKITLIKYIPLLAGLGGGSADAAAVINALNILFDTRLSDTDLISIAKSVGADVPFCVFGATMRARGIGEILTPVKNLKKLYFVIIKQGKKASTAQMFKEIDSASNLKFTTENMLNAIEKNEDISGHIANCFETVYNTQTERKILSAYNPKAICLSGSGPSVYAVFQNESDALSCEKDLLEKGVTAYFCESVDVPFEIE